MRTLTLVLLACTTACSTVFGVDLDDAHPRADGAPPSVASAEPPDAEPTLPPPDAACPAKSTRCGDACVELSSEAHHCGACGVVCAEAANAVALCSDGTCRSACKPGFVACGGACVAESAVACGLDCRTCPKPENGWPTCTAGRCSVTCDVGFVPKNGACEPG